MSSRAGRDTTTYPNNIATPTVTMQELASAGPSAIESIGPEPFGPVVTVEVVGPDGERLTFNIRCGLFAAGGDHE